MKSRYYIGAFEFEWDEKKNRTNRKKHGVWFEEAKQVFNDPRVVQFFDEDHSQREDRFIMLGSVAPGRILVVIYCYRRKGDTIRIISARSATRREEIRYEERI